MWIVGKKLFEWLCEADELQETLHLHPPSEMKKSCFAYNSQTSPSAKKYCGNYSCFQKLCFLWIRQQRGQGWGVPLKVTEALRTLDRRAALPDIPRQGVSSMSRRDRHAPLSVPPEPFLFTFLTLPLSHESYVIKCQLRDTSLVTSEHCASQPCCWKSSRHAHSICLDDEHQEYFCRPDRVEENLSPNQHLFSLVLYAFALVVFCVWTPLEGFPSLFVGVWAIAGQGGYVWSPQTWLCWEPTVL